MSHNGSPPDDALPHPGATHSPFQLPPFRQILDHVDERHTMSVPRPSSLPSQPSPTGYGPGMASTPNVSHPAPTLREVASGMVPMFYHNTQPPGPPKPLVAQGDTPLSHPSLRSDVRPTTTFVPHQPRRLHREEPDHPTYATRISMANPVDGEPVNAKWGMTKVGKPRKRLAQACTTCREKKIKCEPSHPKCVQCQRTNRECRFEPM